MYEKLDGSIATLYWYADEWQLSSSARPDGTGWLIDMCSFGDVFWEIWKAAGYAMPQDREYCYMFEMMTTRLKVICDVAEDRIVLHGVRHMGTLKEEAPRRFAEKNGWQCVRTCPLRCMAKVREAARKLDPKEKEGFVVCDRNFHRRKVSALCIHPACLLADHHRVHAPESVSTPRICRRPREDPCLTIPVFRDDP